MKKNEWQNVFGRAPGAFKDRVACTLNHLEKPMRRANPWRVVIAAAMVVTLLVGGAVAASRLRLFEIMDTADPIEPLQGADMLIATDLGTAENEWVRLVVEEGVFDGFGAMVKLTALPQNPEKYALYFDMANLSSVKDDYMTKSVQHHDDIITEEVVGRKDGRQILLVGMPNLVVPALEPENALELGLEGFFQTFSPTLNEDGSVTFWVSGSGLNASAFDELSIDVKMDVFDLSHEPLGSLDGLTFVLSKESKERHASLIPTGDNTGERFEIISAQIDFTQVKGYLSIDYQYTQIEGEEMGITFIAYDGEGNQINTGPGTNTKVVGGAVDGATDRLKMEIQSFETLPEKIVLEAKVIDEDKVLGRVEFDVKED